MLRDITKRIGGLLPVYRLQTGVLGNELPQAGADSPSLMFPLLTLPADGLHEWMYWVEQSNFPAGFWPLEEDGSGQRGPFPPGNYSALVGIYRNGVKVFSVPVYMVVGDGVATVSSTGGTIWTSHSSDGQSFSQERQARAPRPGDAQKRVGWRTCGTISNWRIQRFRWLSDTNVSVLRLNVVIEPLKTRPGNG
jgi:hypothetical protein